MKKTLLIDMDCILVNMLPPWLNRYNSILRARGQVSNVSVADLESYNVGLVCKDTEVLYDILDERSFFFNMEPMPGAVEYFQKLLDDDRYDVVVVTQPPRCAEFAVRDKRRWILKHFPNFDLKNMVFCHRKTLVKGDLIFDDKPEHLSGWKIANPKGVLATLDWKFTDVPTDFRGSLENGWEEFYNFVTSLSW